MKKLLLILALIVPLIGCSTELMKVYDNSGDTMLVDLPALTQASNDISRLIGNISNTYVEVNGIFMPFVEYGEENDGRPIYSTDGEEYDVVYFPSVQQWRFFNNPPFGGAYSNNSTSFLPPSGWYANTTNSSDKIFVSFYTGVEGDLHEAVEAVDAKIGPPCYGSLYKHDATNLMAIVTTNYNMITNWSTVITNSQAIPTNVVLSSTGITVKVAGTFDCHVSLSIGVTGGGYAPTLECALFVNGVEQKNAEFDRKIGTSGDIGSGSFFSQLTLASNDNVSVRIQGDSAGNITVRQAQLVITRVGATGPSGIQRDEFQSKGCWLFTATNKVYYSSFTNAYNNAIAGDTIELDSGTNNLGAITFSFNKAVNVVGQGRNASVLLANGFTWEPAATNCTISGITLTHPTTSTNNLFISTAVATNVLNVSLRDVQLYSRVVNANNHTFEWSGRSNKLENVHTDGGTGHVFVLKGCMDTSVSDCSSRGGTFDGLLIKGGDYSTGNKGPCENIIVNDFVSEGGPLQSAGLQVVAYNSHTNNNINVDGFVHKYAGIGIGLAVLVDTDGMNTNVFIKNAQIRGAAYGAQIGAYSGSTSALTRISATISDSELNSTTFPVLLFGGGAGHLSVANISGVCPTNINNVINWQATGSYLSSSVRNCSLTRTDGSRINVESTFYESRNQQLRPLVTTLRTQVSPSTGCTSTFFRVSGVNTSTAVSTIIFKGGTNHNVAITNVFAGDPVWCVTPATSFVAKVLSSGTIGTNDDILASSVVGDQYITFSSTNLVTNGMIRLGKVGAMLTGTRLNNGMLSLNSRVSGALTITAGTISQYAEATDVASVQYQSSTYSFPQTSVATQPQSLYTKIYVRSFIIANTVYVGAFADGYTVNLAAVQGTWKDLILDVSMYNSGVMLDALKPINVLP